MRTFQKGDEPPTLEDLEKIGYSRQAAAKLKEIGGKNVLDLDRKYGFKVTSKYVDKEYGTRWEVSYSPVRGADGGSIQNQYGRISTDKRYFYRDITKRCAGWGMFQ